MRTRLMILMISAALLGTACKSDDDNASSGTDGGSAGTEAAAGTSGGKAGTSGGEAGTTMTAGMGGGTADAGAEEDAATGPVDIVATALAAGSFTKLAEALTTADLVETLQGDGPFTVFAPTDDAFAAFEDENPGVLAGLSKAELTAILTYHVISGDIASTDLKDGSVAVTVNGSPILIELGDDVKVGGSKVTTPDIECSNGVIHVIDSIILPPSDDIVATAIAAGTFTSLAGALTDADLVSALQGPGPFTVFAPTDAAFAKLAEVPTGDALKNVLLYHVVEGAIGSGDLTEGEVATLLENESVTIDLSDGAMVNDSKVTMANIITKNGVIHVIDTVLVP